MMKRNDSRPWAFDNNPPWQSFMRAAEQAGLRLIAVSAWGDGHDSRLRGDNLVKFRVHYGESGALAAMMVAEGFGPDGFEIYLTSGLSEVQQEIAALVYRGRAAAG